MSFKGNFFGRWKAEKWKNNEIIGGEGWDVLDWCVIKISRVNTTRAEEGSRRWGRLGCKQGENKLFKRISDSWTSVGCEEINFCGVARVRGAAWSGDSAFFGKLLGFSRVTPEESGITNSRRHQSIKRALPEFFPLPRNFLLRSKHWRLNGT